MAVEWGPDGVRVVGVAPGLIENTVGFNKLGERYFSLLIISARWTR
jgi:NAD(P)-dependent dehydrogenase (short-subunit alcohol dehydrogenase family)